MYIIGIDIGTTNSKICLFELPHFKLVQHYRFTTPKRVDDHYTDFDIHEIWKKIKFGIKAMTEQTAIAEEIRSISVASVGESIVLLNREGSVIGPVITWYDRRSVAQANHIRDSVGSDGIYSITGIPPHSNYSIAKLLWLKENYKQEIKSVYKWLCLADYIAYRLTGEMKTEYTLASRTMAYDIVNKRWSENILDVANVDPTFFPEVVESGTVIGQVKRTLAEELGLGAKTKVAIAGHDHMVGSLCTGLSEGDDLLNSTGTTEGLLVVQESPQLDEVFLQNHFSNGIYVHHNLYTLFASLPSAGYAVEWFKRVFLNGTEKLHDVIFELYSRYKKNPLSSLESLPVFIPHLRGSGPPYRSAHSKGMFYGFTEGTDEYDILFSIFTGLCFELKTLFKTLEQLLQRSFSTMKVIGPASRNPLWLQLKADVLNCTVKAYQIDEAVAKGAAISTTLKQNLFKNIEELSLDQEIEVYKPHIKRVPAYDNYYQDYYLPLTNLKRKLEFGVER